MRLALHGHAVMRDHRRFIDFAADRRTGTSHAATAAAATRDCRRCLRRGRWCGRLAALSRSLRPKRQG